MKINKKKSSLFKLLIRHYIGFTLALITVAMFLYGLTYLKLFQIMKEPQVDRLIHYQESIALQGYESIPVEKLLGKGGFIEVLDQNNKSIYLSNKEQTPTEYTDKELEYIGNYPNIKYAYSYTYKSDTGKEQTMITLTYYLENGEFVEDYIIIDEHRNILYANKDYGQKQFTEGELSYLTDTAKENYSIQKYVNEQGYKIIMYMPKIDEGAIDKAFVQLEHANYFFIVFYILMIILFVYWLNKKVKKPLFLFNEALKRFAGGDKEVELNYKGTYEFEEICESFNSMARRLVESEAKRSQLEADKQKMLADISHDLKTPITIIQGYCKAICDGMVSEEKLNQYLMTIYHKSNGLTELINTFYEYSKLEHPEFRLSLEKYDLYEYMRTYLIEKYSEVSLLGFNLDIDIPETKLMFKLDRIQLRRAFENILSNAIKHNPKGTTLYVKIYEEADSIKIILADDGLGIPKHLTKEVFNPFVVGDESRNHKQGSGLGLAITKRIVQAHGGSIRLVLPPEKNYKTQFEITFLKES